MMITNIDEITSLIEKYDVVTFDVFDTLLIRDVMRPTDVFRFSYGEIGRYIRILAEMKARRTSTTGEVLLSDIEKYCLFSCDKEVEFEKRICRANPLIKEIYDTAQKMGKRIYAISDMYLSKNVISDLLSNAGFDIPVYVSCEQRYDKTSGKLFDCFINDCSLNPTQVIHIGDNYKADYLGAKKAGIKSIIINKHCNQLAYTKYTKKNYELAAFINHGICRGNLDEAEKIGYEIIGPIILSFCQWIHEIYLNKKIKRLFFLARDMRFSYEIYRSLYPEDNADYLFVSRKSLLFAKDKPSAFCDYLKNAGCYGNVYIVDTGWIGNAQVEIEKYAKMIDDSSDIGGLYLGSKLAYRMIKRSKSSYICLYSSRIEQFKCQLYPPFMETLIGCNEKQVIRYENGKPVFDRDFDRDNTNSLKSGAKKFIFEWVKIKHNQTIPKSNVKRPFEKMFYNPKMIHIDLMGKLLYEDEKDSQIVSFDENCHYWRNPGKMLSDLADSGWKGAFLKKMGIMYPVILFLYVTLGSIRLYSIDKKNTNNTN